jgi:hypothetical protein
MPVAHGRWWLTRATTVRGLSVLAVIGSIAGQGCTWDRSAAEPHQLQRVLPAGEHPIGVRTGDGSGQFFDRRTGRTFHPRGPTYLQSGVDALPRPALFAPGEFDEQAVARDLQEMRALGFNTVRVFIDACRPPAPCITLPDGRLDPDYMGNLATFLRIAEENDLFVLLASNDVPELGYAARLPCCEPFGGYRNSLYLSREGVEIARQYWRDVIVALRGNAAPLESVLAYEITQEQFVLSDIPPLSLDTGTITTGNGRTYDLADETARQSMVEDNLLHHIAEVRRTIGELDPTALVTMGFFVPSGPNRARSDDNRVVLTNRVVQESALDFVDIHAYPRDELSLEEAAENFGIRGTEAKPVVMGEFGGVVGWYPSARAAADDLVAYQVESCALGVDGWLHWLWEDTVTDVFGSLVEGGVINEALSPRHRPDPCRAGEPA